MGCGNGKRTQQKPSDGSPSTNPQYKVLELLKLPKSGDVSSTAKEAATIQGSFADAEGDNKCLLCLSSNPQKAHTLDCTHSLCMNCAREQLEMQLRNRVSYNIIYYCKTCKAPKNLSKFHFLVVTTKQKIETIWLSCDCVVDALQLDKGIRTVVSPDKIVRFDMKEKKIKYPMCLKSHTLTHEDLVIMYGKRAQKLDLYRAQLKSDILLGLVEELNKHKNIVDLVLDQANLRKCSPESIIKLLKELKYIKSISLRCAKMDRPALEGLYAGLKGNQRLLFLDLYATGLTGENITALSTAISTSFSLQTLDLSEVKMDKETLKQLCTIFLRKTRTLQTLMLDSIGLDAEGAKELCECLAQNDSVKKFSLANNLFQEEQAGEVSGLLAKNQVIEQLNLAGIFANDKCWALIGKGLGGNKKITSLVLDGNNMESSDLGLMSDALGKHKSLKTLSLADNGLDEAAGTIVGSFVAASRSLEEINLKCNYLCAQGVEAIMNGLKTNVGVKILNLRKNTIGKEGAVFIASYLRGSPSFLEELDASSDGVEEAGGMEIMNALKENKSLKKLLLGDNGLADEFATAMAGMIKVNATLEFLSLESNLITNKGAQIISEELGSAKGIHTLNIENNVYTQFGALAVLRARLTNLRVKVITSEVTHFVTSLG